MSTNLQSPPSTPLASSEDSALALFLGSYDLTNRRVVEVGGMAPPAAVFRTGVSHWLSIDPANQSAMSTNSYSILCQSASAIPADDSSIDFAFSANAFEHVQELPKVLSELRRVLKPDGILHAHFGPIWSAPDGHHMELTVDGQPYRFWKEAVVPPWLHLVVVEDEFVEALAAALPRRHAEEIGAFCYRSPVLNRLRFEDYLSAFREAGFLVRRIQPLSEIDYAWRLGDFTHPVAKWLSQFPSSDAVKERFGIRGDITCRDIFAELFVQ